MLLRGELWRPGKAAAFLRLGLRWHTEGKEPKPVRVYRRQRAEHWRTFQWGIGSKFRMQSKNRFTPVHAPHPMHSVVRDDYYHSENPSVAARWSLESVCKSSARFGMSFARAGRSSGMRLGI